MSVTFHILLHENPLLFVFTALCMALLSLRGFAPLCIGYLQSTGSLRFVLRRE